MVVTGLIRTDKTRATGQEINAIIGAEPRRLAVLDSLRGIAALIVVVHHCLLTQPAFSDFFFSTWQTPPHGFAQYILFHSPLRIIWDGYEAVTLFYVLSGLVLTLPWVEGRRPSYLSFATKRVCRIYLPYCVAVIGAAVLNTVFHLSADIPGASGWVNTMTWSNPVTRSVLLDHMLMIGHYNTVDGVIHSLIWEMRVSLIFPFLVVPIALWRERGAVGVLIALIAVIIAIQLAFPEPDAGIELLQSRPYLGIAGKLALELQWTAYYACFFVVGAVITLKLRVIRALLIRLPGWMRLVWLAAGLMVIQGHWSQIHFVQEVMVSLGSALTIAAALSPGAIEGVLTLPPLLFLGRISYSVYLIHVPLLLTIVAVLQSVPILLLLAVVPPASVLVGWLFHIAVAEPCARLGQQLSHPARDRKPIWRSLKVDEEADNSLGRVP